MHPCSIAPATISKLSYRHVTDCIPTTWARSGCRLSTSSRQDPPRYSRNFLLLHSHTTRSEPLCSFEQWTLYGSLTELAGASKMCRRVALQRQVAPWDCQPRDQHRTITAEDMITMMTLRPSISPCAIQLTVPSVDWQEPQAGSSSHLAASLPWQTSAAHWPGKSKTTATT